MPASDKIVFCFSSLPDDKKTAAIFYLNWRLYKSSLYDLQYSAAKQSSELFRAGAFTRRAFNHLTAKFD